MTGTIDEPNDGTQSVRRSFLLLGLLADAPPPGLTLSEISRALGLAVPTTHRMLKGLLQVGAAEQMAHGRRYIVGARLGVLAAGRPPQLRLIDQARPHLARGRALGQVAWLSGRAHLDATCLANMVHPRFSGPLVPVGSHKPLGMPSASLAMLAALDEEEANGLIRQNWHRLSQLDVDPSDARRQLQEARRRSFALRRRGRITGLTTLSVAFRPFDGRHLAALTIGSVPELATPRWIERAARFLAECRQSFEAAA